jgi:hypothetical protein
MAPRRLCRWHVEVGEKVKKKIATEDGAIKKQTEPITSYL